MVKEIRVNDNEIILNNAVISKPVHLRDIESFLNNKPSRIVRGINTIRIYDDEGIYVYLDKKINSEVSQIDLQMEIQHWLAFAPNSVYTGKLYIRGNEIRSIDELLSFTDVVLNTDELEGDGVISLFLNQVGLAVTINLDTKALQNISIWYLSNFHS
jgi:hypothetical protein